MDQEEEEKRKQAEAAEAAANAVSVTVFVICVLTIFQKISLFQIFSLTEESETGPDGKKKNQKKAKKSNKSKANQRKNSKKSNTPQTGNDLSTKIFATMEKHKEVFFVIRLHSVQTAASLGVILPRCPFSFQFINTMFTFRPFKIPIHSSVVISWMDVIHSLQWHVKNTTNFHLCVEPNSARWQCCMSYTIKARISLCTRATIVRRMWKHGTIA